MSRLPERDTRQSPAAGRFRWRPSNALIAVIFILIFTLGPYLAFTGHVPFTSYGYELNATFSNSANIAVKSPVRIAGVEVGEVVSTSRNGNDTNVTFTVEGAGRPIHADAYADDPARGSSSRATSSSNSTPAAPARRNSAAAGRSRSAAPRPRSSSTKSSPRSSPPSAPTSAAC